MATVRFYTRSQTKNPFAHVPIYCRFSAGRGNTWLVRTGYTIQKDQYDPQSLPVLQIIEKQLLHFAQLHPDKLSRSWLLSHFPTKPIHIK